MRSRFNTFDSALLLKRYELERGGVLRKMASLSATLFGVGRIKFMPGTWGTLVTLPLVFALSQFGPMAYMMATVVFSIYAIFASEAYESEAQKHDSSEIVIDEAAGILVTMAWMPQTWQAYLAGFLLFRFLDILKPFPISFVDKRVGRGLGVVADDLLAGIIANVILQMIYNSTSLLGAQWVNL